MYPLISLGPLNLSSGGLALLAALLLFGWQFERHARRIGGSTLAKQASGLVFPIAAGATIGGRLWYGLTNWDLYGSDPLLFLALRVGDLAWAGALLGGLSAAWVACRWRSADPLPLADAAALALPPAVAITSVGLLLSGEAFGAPSNLPWAVPLFGVLRHPTQLYYALAALASWIVLAALNRRGVRARGLLVAWLGLQGLTMLLVEALRADSVALPGGVRLSQLVGLGLLLAALTWARATSRRAPAANPRLASSGRQW